MFSTKLKPRSDAYSKDPPWSPRKTDGSRKPRRKYSRTQQIKDVPPPTDVVILDPTDYTHIIASGDLQHQASTASIIANGFRISVSLACDTNSCPDSPILNDIHLQLKIDPIISVSEDEVPEPTLHNTEISACNLEPQPDTTCSPEQLSPVTLQCKVDLCKLSPEILDNYTIPTRSPVPLVICETPTAMEIDQPADLSDTSPQEEFCNPIIINSVSLSSDQLNPSSDIQPEPVHHKKRLLRKFFETESNEAVELFLEKLNSEYHNTLIPAEPAFKALRQCFQGVNNPTEFQGISNSKYLPKTILKKDPTKACGFTV